MQLGHADAGEDQAAVSGRAGGRMPRARRAAAFMSVCVRVCVRRLEVLMQANMLTSEYDEIADMHKKVVRVSGRRTGV